MNISKDIQELAASLDVETMSTGGGSDYAYRQFDNGMWAVLINPVQDGSPHDLNAPASVIIYRDEQWQEFVEIPVKDARAGLHTIAAMTPSHANNSNNAHAAP